MFVDLCFPVVLLLGTLVFWWTWIYTCIYIYIWTYILIYTYICVYLHIYTYIRVYTYIQICKKNICIHTFIYACMHHMYVYMYVYIMYLYVSNFQQTNFTIHNTKYTYTYARRIADWTFVRIPQKNKTGHQRSWCVFSPNCCRNGRPFSEISLHICVPSSWKIENSDSFCELLPQ